MQITNESAVSIHYKLTNPEGELLDTSEGQKPLVYLQGKGNIIPGLEKELEGKSAGDKVTAVIEPKDAYGEFQDDFLQTVPKAQFEDQTDVKVGMQFQVMSEQGARIVTIKDVQDETVTVDFNHPLAGVTLHFDVEVVDVREATAKELEHGHVHADDGCGCGEEH